MDFIHLLMASKVAVLLVLSWASWFLPILYTFDHVINSSSAYCRRYLVPSPLRSETLLIWPGLLLGRSLRRFFLRGATNDELYCYQAWRFFHSFCQIRLLDLISAEKRCCSLFLISLLLSAGTVDTKEANRNPWSTLLHIWIQGRSSVSLGYHCMLWLACWPVNAKAPGHGTCRFVDLVPRYRILAWFGTFLSGILLDLIQLNIHFSTRSFFYLSRSLVLIREWALS